MHVHTKKYKNLLYFRVPLDSFFVKNQGVTVQTNDTHLVNHGPTVCMKHCINDTNQSGPAGQLLANHESALGKFAGQLPLKQRVRDPAPNCQHTASNLLGDLASLMLR